MSERLRELAEKATPGPWRGTTIGTRSQGAAAQQAYDAVMARRLEDNPEVQFTDMSWVRTEGDDWLNVALIGNGRNGPENAAYIGAVDPQTVLRLLRIEAAAAALIAEPWKSRSGKPSRNELTAALRDALQEDSHVGK